MIGAKTGGRVSPSPVSSEILTLLKSRDCSALEIADALPTPRKIRTVRRHLGLLHKAGKVEMFVKIGDLRRPRYRLVTP